MKYLRICFVFMFVFLCLSFVSSAEYNVGEGLEYETIQSAIDGVSENSIIYLDSGEYSEDLIIEKNLTIIGNSEERSLITGRVVVKDDVSFENIDFKHESSGWGQNVRGVLALKASNKTLTIKNSNITQLGISDGIILGTSSGGNNYIGMGLNLDNVSLYANNGESQGVSVKESFAVVNINNSFIEADSSRAYPIILQGPNHILNVINSNVSAPKYHAIRITYSNNMVIVKSSNVTGYGAISMGGVGCWEANNTHLIVRDSNIRGIRVANENYGAISDDGVNGTSIEIYNSSIVTDNSEDTDRYSAIRLWGNNTNLLVKNSFIQSKYNYVIVTSSVEDHDYNLNITHNYWGCGCANFDNFLEGDFNAFPYYKNRKMTKLSNKVKKNLAPSMELNSSMEIEIGEGSAESEINVSGDINVTFDVSEIINCSCGCKKARLQNGLCLNLKNNKMKGSVRFPRNITMSGNESWDGKTSLPVVKVAPKANPIVRTGYSSRVSKVIEIGNENVDLEFDRGVRLLLEDYAGSNVGFIKQDGIFHEISRVCDNDSQEFADSLVSGGECKIDVGDDLVVWTKHFTEFVIYEEVLADVEVSSSSGRSRGACVYDVNFDWNCSDWGECLNGFQFRECKKYNNCGNSYGRPILNGSCSYFVSEQGNSLVNMALQNSKIFFDEDLKLRIDFVNCSQKEKEVDVQYFILNNENENVYTENEKILMREGKSIIKTFKRLSLDEGEYRIIATLFYDNKSESVEKDFELMSLNSFVTGNVILDDVERVSVKVVPYVMGFLIILLILIKFSKKNK